MRLFKVFRLEDGSLTTDPMDNQVQEIKFVGQFFADAHCDFIKNMVELNIQEGRCDKSLNKLEERIKKEGI